MTGGFRGEAGSTVSHDVFAVDVACASGDVSARSIHADALIGNPAANKFAWMCRLCISVHNGRDPFNGCFADRIAWCGCRASAAYVAII